MVEAHVQTRSNGHRPPILKVDRNGEGSLDRRASSAMPTDMGGAPQ
jgi:hypothetical protein